MNTRLIAFIAAVALHLYLFWFGGFSGNHDSLAAGDPLGDPVMVELVEESGPPEAVEAPPEEVMPPEPEPTPESPPPEPEPMPEPEPEPPPPTPDAMQEPVPEPPKPKPTPAPKPAVKKPAAAKPSAKPGPPQEASSSAAAGNAGSASSGSSSDAAHASYRRKVKPVYPPTLRNSGIITQVKVVVTINSQGKLVSARVSQSGGNALFDESALRASYAAEYNPRLDKGVPVDDTVTLRFRFEPGK
jgi:protein TonB